MRVVVQAALTVIIVAIVVSKLMDMLKPYFGWGVVMVLAVLIAFRIKHHLERW